jgi:hypothetical protein
MICCVKNLSGLINQIGHSSQKQAPTMGFLQMDSKTPLISAPGQNIALPQLL